jgi:hypothetical protein
MKTVLACVLLLFLAPAWAHKPSDSYLDLRIDGQRIEGHWDIALRDLDTAVGLDGNGDGRLTWDELRARHRAIAAYALARLTVSAQGVPCTLHAGEQPIDEHTDGMYTVLPLHGRCPVAPARLTVGYRLFADTDAQHRGLLRLQAGDGVRTAILGGERPVQTLMLAASPGSTFATYVRHGIWHIGIGWDHVLFLVSLLLPAVLVRRDGAWWGVAAPGDALADALKSVTAFTVAHTATLALAALGAVAPPSRWVESAIAASVAIAALNNVWPLLPGRRWIAAFGFGLVHGFGFAGVLADLGLPRGAEVLALLGFNVGVELGQLAIVGALLPAAFAVRRTRAYRNVLLPAGSCAIAAVAALWLAERAFGLALPGG